MTLVTLDSLPPDVDVLAVKSAFTYRRTEYLASKSCDWHDIVTIEPREIWVGWRTGGDDGSFYHAVLPATVETMVKLKDLGPNVVAVVEDVKREYFVARALGLTSLGFLVAWDLGVAGRCLGLGASDTPTSLRPTFDEDPLATRAAQLKRQEPWQRRRAPTQPQRHQKALSSFDFDAPRGSSDNDIAGDLKAMLALYDLQKQEAAAHDLTSALTSLEFPYAEANAWVEWAGTRISRDIKRYLTDLFGRVCFCHQKALKDLGVLRPGDPRSFAAAARRLGITAALRPTTFGDELVDGDRLKELAAEYPLVRHHLQLGRYKSQLQFFGSPWYLGKDRRLHPQHLHNGASTGRNTCIDPCVTNLKRELRVIYTPAPGFGLLDFDLASADFFVLGALSGDHALMTACRADDFYAEIASLAFGATDFELKQRMKTALLATLNGQGARGTAKQLKISVTEAEALLKRLWALFPTAKLWLDTVTAAALRRKFITMAGGLRRRLPTDLRPEDMNWGRAALRSAVVQGSTAAVLKQALVQLHAEYQGTEVKVTLTNHDSLFVEAPLAELAQVTAKVMGLIKEASRRILNGHAVKVRVSDVGSLEKYQRYVEKVESEISDLSAAREEAPNPWPDIPVGDVELDRFTERRAVRRPWRRELWKFLDQWEICASWEIEEEQDQEEVHHDEHAREEVN